MNNAGLDEKYYEWKDIFIHSILIPILDVKDDKHEFTIYATRNFNDLMTDYDEDSINRIDKNYNHMAKLGLLVLIKITKKEDLSLIQKRGYDSDSVFGVFKDDLLKANPMTQASYEIVDSKTFIQKNLN